MKSQMKAGEIWAFPLADGKTKGFLRVVMSLRDLALPAKSPLAFVADCYLIQISRESQLGQEIFKSKNLLVNGTFLAPMKSLDEFGYQRLEASRAEAEDIEFPWWFMNVSTGPDQAKVVFCRGDFEYDVPSLSRDEIEQQWGGCYVARRYPAQLSCCVEPGLLLTERFRKTDIRYHSKRDEILKHIGIDVSPSYMSLVKARDASLNAYVSAIAGKRFK